ncbi:hypothetical protein [Sphingosinicella sp. LY1275]|uniref:hypothetical protein n=1 Tax=Sphingosinicella sp. LY1275 TaxID=3095379 RepID=UPI002ADEF732|nr:hypothetical protein [Sphingosinicella sp. LY1275]MEA1015034.1 hypothetical protein [Sphingosinicella sp. LY1275]
MKTVQQLFADLTAALEDVHGVAIEGQSAHASKDMQASLLSCVRAGLLWLEQIADSIAVALATLPR